VALDQKTSYNGHMPFFRVLGPLEAVTDEGARIDLGGPRARAVLAVLLLRAGHVVSVDSLIASIWGESAPKAATASLQNSISALRKALGPGGPDLLRRQPPGYLLDVNGTSLDLAHFEHLRADAAGAEPLARARLLREALDLWRGEPLAEFAYEPFRDDIRNLEELRLLTDEEWIEAELELGRDAELVPHLESLVSEHWSRERLIEQLMVALYRAGRQKDALDVYQTSYRRFVEELGGPPGPRLQRLHTGILNHEVGLHPSAAAASPAEHVEEVAMLVLSGKLVPVLGADVAELVTHLAARFAYPAGEPDDFARVAQYVSLTKGSGPLYDELNEMLASSTPPSALHRFFASLPPLLRDRGLPHQLLVTTGYDLALEQAFLDAGEEFDVVSYVASGRSRGRFCHVQPDGTSKVIDVPNTYATELSLDRRTAILKLHGGVELERFVVTEDDYIDYLAYGDVGSAIPVGLAAKLRRSHFLFLGYRMCDWNLRLVLERMWGADGAAYRSWAVQPDPKPLERQFWRARDVDLLEVSLDEYATALGRYLTMTTEATA
jgi:DNA-binding SARP family transcriptional activator